jgi:hypothetical protein
MTVSPLNTNPVTDANANACLLGIKVTTPANRRPEEAPSWMMVQIQEILNAIPAPWFSIVIIHQSQAIGLVMQWDGPSVVDYRQVDKVVAPAPVPPTPPSPLDRMDTAFGDDK